MSMLAAAHVDRARLLRIRESQRTARRSSELQSDITPRPSSPQGYVLLPRWSKADD